LQTLKNNSSIVYQAEITFISYPKGILVHSYLHRPRLFGGHRTYLLGYIVPVFWGISG
jgi:hypothetical protein